MAKPALGASLERYERYLRYLWYALKANPDTRDKAPEAEEQLTAIVRLRAALKERDNLVLERRAVVGYWDARLDPLIKTIQAAAKFADAQDGRLHIVHLFFDRKSVSAIIRPTGTGLGREIEDARILRRVFDLVPEAAATEAVRKLVPALDADIAGAQQSWDALMVAVGERKLEQRKITPTKRAVRTALDRIEGLLLTQFAGQRDLVRSFYLPSDEQSTPEETSEHTNPEETTEQTADDETESAASPAEETTEE